nr:reverse transcriptase domain-containing protein [Tanacetum cinerariifolium]
MQKRRNDVKERTTLLLDLPNEHQLRFSKYKTAQELWAAILKTFGGNEATKKTKNLLKQQYGNFKAERKETLEQTFNRLQVIVSQLESMDVEINGNEEDITAGVPTASTQVSTAGATINKDDIKEKDSMRADRYWKKTGKKISIQGTNVAGFDKLKNSQKQGNARAMVTAPTDGSFLCVNDVLLTMLDSVRSSVTSAKRNECPKKVKQEEVGEAHGRAYAIKDAEPQGPNMVTGTFLLNNRYAFVLFDSGFDRSFMDTRFSDMLDIDPIKIGAS